MTTHAELRAKLDAETRRLAEVKSLIAEVERRVAAYAASKGVKPLTAAERHQKNLDRLIDNFRFSQM
jgi:hypothetical protein